MAAKFSSASYRNCSKASKGLEYYWCPCDADDAEKVQTKVSESEPETHEEIDTEKKSLWETILQESAERDAPYIAWLKEREETESADLDSAAGYLDREIFPILLPAMEQMLHKARQWNALAVQKCRFDGLDYLAESLWNKNPRWPGRSSEWLEAFDIPQFKLCLRLNPRPIFPKSWLWTVEEAALHIQRWTRGWLVRKRGDVQEMRQFWKEIAADKETLDEDSSSKISRDSRALDICERHELRQTKNQRGHPNKVGSYIKN